MIRVKFVKDHKQYKSGDIETLSPNEAFGLIDSGKAIVSKDMVESDTVTTEAKKSNYKPAKIRSFNIKEK